MSCRDLSPWHDLTLSPGTTEIPGVPYFLFSGSYFLFSGSLFLIQWFLFFIQWFLIFYSVVPIFYYDRLAYAPLFLIKILIFYSVVLHFELYIFIQWYYFLFSWPRRQARPGPGPRKSRNREASVAYSSPHSKMAYNNILEPSMKGGVLRGEAPGADSRTGSIANSD